MGGKITLVLGGARSGKSRCAENLAIESGLSRLYLATAQAFDSEMENRIARHQEDRGSGWKTVEEPLDLSGAIITHSAKGRIILVDCLTLWLSNLMASNRPIKEEFEQLIDTIKALPGPLVLVSNEVGQGIVPDNALSRAFRDHAGRLHQQIAEIADEVYFITAGLPQKLK
ncbi:bifunctional adenosylcobinamide kinase/adenosylcobinamide-phosphate guanylyltransferase [Sneathiella sp. HT1-7]|jgi:adenosylcobinamide kinase/adenosylcobinamide-phosphate guanylyltransferase|uniref:bifunctional adenosylcobinamide kinase/adenosylcobinamide-phosphate guanylyltransferase n=1 Tax=Sneathiella sp. HT1-7 TaxID=2887192 RepID=UPI001D13DC34|nr:bifunctional adenosylcobinamide kinase/adenosylcobinamide-phosphate guanylyltransferase [Sneathiella sp. HT1-7]MCC3304477.1 bifunctional adenosylcobinamide kinase/adenosylcobinamide-phosphate guanylyltransferase [Sneathiella sp. HT1-7]